MQRGTGGFAAVLMLGWAFAGSCRAEGAQSCLRIDEQRQIEERRLDAEGRATVKLKDAANVSRGQTLLFTLKATNACDDSINPAVIEFTVPAGVIYTVGSATGAGTAITFSINGKSFGKFESLAIHDAGAPRAARAEDIRYIRWVLLKALAPHTSRTVRFRATVR